MSALGIVVLQLGDIFIGLINIYIWILIISALLSFVNPDPYNPFVQLLTRITEPTYSFVRKKIQTNFNGLDLAPLIIIIALQIIIVLLNYIFTTIASSI